MNSKFCIPKNSVRESVDGRHYAVDDQKLPSVTTILKRNSIRREKTGSRWPIGHRGVGEDAAENGSFTETAARGTAMHKLLKNIF